MRVTSVAGRRRDSDRGSATVWSLAAIAVLCVVFGAVLALGQAVLARHRAAGGADLAALAAADHWADGEAAACARAGRVARAQGARVVRCTVAGEVSDVTAASGQGPFTAEVRARAGPPGPALPSEGSPEPVPQAQGSLELVPPVQGYLELVPPPQGPSEPVPPPGGFPKPVPPPRGLPEPVPPPRGLPGLVPPP